MKIELRFYRERFNMDEEYYTGDDDIYCKKYYKSFKGLKSKWNSLLDSFEGETYSAWIVDGDWAGHMLCGGAFDPDDIEIIADNLGEEE